MNLRAEKIQQKLYVYVIS